jgi:hypothetical protein
MGNDYLKKEPSKTEKMMYELYMQMQNMERGLWSTSTLVMVSAMLNKLEPKDVAELMVNGGDKIKEFSKLVNEEIDKLEKAKNPGHTHEGHDHAHDIKPEDESQISEEKS